MGLFSPDGAWWWDGARWVATTGIQLVLPETEFERSGGLKAARKLMTIREWIFVGMYVAGITVIGLPLILVLVIAYWIVQFRAYKAYRQWTLELLSLATAQLLDPDEPMLACETTIYPRTGFWPSMRRDNAIAVARAHVLMFWFDHFDSPAIRVVFAARPPDVDLMLINGWIRISLVVAHQGRRWFLPGIRGIPKGQQVIDAWRNVLVASASRQ